MATRRARDGLSRQEWYVGTSGGKGGLLRLSRQIEAFWRSGALAGRSPSQLSQHGLTRAAAMCVAKRARNLFIIFAVGVQRYCLAGARVRSLPTWPPGARTRKRMLRAHERQMCTLQFRHNLLIDGIIHFLLPRSVLAPVALLAGRGTARRARTRHARFPLLAPAQAGTAVPALVGQDRLPVPCAAPRDRRLAARAPRYTPVARCGAPGSLYLPLISCSFEGANFEPGGSFQACKACSPVATLIACSCAATALAMRCCCARLASRGMPAAAASGASSPRAIASRRACTAASQACCSARRASRAALSASSC